MVKKWAPVGIICQNDVYVKLSYYSTETSTTPSYIIQRKCEPGFRTFVLPSFNLSNYEPSHSKNVQDFLQDPKLAFQ